MVPRNDAFRVEQTAECDRRLEWLTGFTGSAGYCIVTSERAVIFVDGRYSIQVEQQVERGQFEIESSSQIQPRKWLAEAFPDEGKIGFDPWLHTITEIERLHDEIGPTGVRLHPERNLLDRIWKDRPAPPASAMTLHPTRFAGEDSDSKRNALVEKMKSEGNAAIVLTKADSIAWLLNLRGADVARTPIKLGYAIAHDNGHLDFFTRTSQDPRITAVEIGKSTQVRRLEEFPSALSRMKGPVWIDPTSAPVKVREILEHAGVDISCRTDPCVMAKAIKNPVQIKGIAEAHRRDGAAMVEFLAWLDSTGETGEISEIDAANAIERFRSETDNFVDLSFDTISAGGPNGAIIHYGVTEETSRTLQSGELYLFDSGGQYLDGTTDVTRTVSIGLPRQQHKYWYTQVLRALIALSSASWPAHAQGRDLDTIARSRIWSAGADYGHSTGHGVGHFLSVHEGPQSISPRFASPLQCNMVLSIEPGIYRNGEFGIRLENLAVVEPASCERTETAGSMYRFRTFTRVPFDRRLISVDELAPREIRWLNDYHAVTHEEIAPRCSKLARKWLASSCAPIS